MKIAEEAEEEGGVAAKEETGVRVEVEGEEGDGTGDEEEGARETGDRRGVRAKPCATFLGPPARPHRATSARQDSSISTPPHPGHTGTPGQAGRARSRA